MFKRAFQTAGILAAVALAVAVGISGSSLLSSFQPVKTAFAQNAGTAASGETPFGFVASGVKKAFQSYLPLLSATSKKKLIAVMQKEDKPYVETFLYSDDLYRPVTAPLQQGSWEYVVTDAAGKAKKYYHNGETYYRLQNGLYVYAENAALTKKVPTAGNTISRVAESSADSSRYTRFTFDFSSKVTYQCDTNQKYTKTNKKGVRNYTISSFSASSFKITFDNTEGEPLPANTWKSPMISSVKSKNLGGGKIEYIFYLKHKGVFYGVDIYYNAGGNLVMDFRNPWNGSLKTIKIVLDPGHGGKDPGALSPGGKYPNEKDLNLSYALMVREKLIAKGVPAKNITMTRTTDKTVSKGQRLSIIVSSGADVSVCIHNNAAEHTNSKTGTESYYYQPFSKLLASSIQTQIVNAFRNGRTAHNKKYYYSNMGKNGGTLFAVTKAYYSTRQLQMPSTLVECGYIDNPKEYKWLKSSTGKDYITTAIANGILNYMETEKKYS